ncbi:hypothetical protein Tco_1385182 [Tanacetum coccineum]
MSSKELVKIRFFSTGHGVKLEGSMNYTNGKSWALLLSIYKWSRQRAPLVQKAASYKHYSKSSELRNKSEASRAVSFMLCPASCSHVFIELSALCTLLHFIKEREPCLESEKKGRRRSKRSQVSLKIEESISQLCHSEELFYRGKACYETLFRPSCFRTGKKKRFFAQLAHSAGPTCISYLAKEASDRLEFLPFWDSMDQDLLLLYGQYQSTLVDHMDVEKASHFDELETSLFHFYLPSSYLCFVCSPEEFDLFNLGIPPK